jgi:CheY-like chemotaxis protein
MVDGSKDVLQSFLNQTGPSEVNLQQASTHLHSGQGSGTVMAEILVVEDDADACESIARFLRAAGHSVSCSSNGREALASMMDKRPDLVLLDVKLPEMDGVTFLTVVRSYVRLADMPVFIITGVDDEVLLAKLATLGVKRVFRKGNYELRDLGDAVAKELAN